MLEPSPPLSSESGLERDWLKRDSLVYNLKAAALFAGVLYIAIILALGSFIELLKSSSIIY